MNLTGVWLGQTMGNSKSAIHVWIITQQNNELTMYTHWFALDVEKNTYWATLTPDYSGVATIHGTSKFMNIVNQNTFYIKDWAANIDGDKEELLAVYFQRRDHGYFALLINTYIQCFRNSPNMLRLLNR